MSHKANDILVDRLKDGMTREEFRELTGDDPEDMFGPDWENTLEDLNRCECGAITKEYVCGSCAWLAKH